MSSPLDENANQSSDATVVNTETSADSSVTNTGENTETQEVSPQLKILEEDDAFNENEQEKQNQETNNTLDDITKKIENIQTTMKEAIEEIQKVKSQTGGKKRKTRKFRLGKHNRSHKKK